MSTSATPPLPDPLRMADGSPVKTPDDWITRRRPELANLFQRDMYGYFPPAPDNLIATTRFTDPGFLSGRATLREVVLKFGPPAAPPINLLIVTPNDRPGPVAAFVGPNFCGNHTLVKSPRVAMPAWVPDWCPDSHDHVPGPAGRGMRNDRWQFELAVDRGYAVASFYNGDVDPDRDDFTDGIHPHYAPPGRAARGPHDWGTIAAWAWGLSRCVDYLITDPTIDPDRIVAVGHSRNGKTALLAAAFDSRIAMAIPLQAGCGGTAPSRGTVGESVRQINTAFPHWFCDEFKRFNDRPDLLPFDQHELVALCAPRPVLFSNATEDVWANPAGQFDVLRAADSVYRLLGVEGLGSDRMPPVNELLDSRLGYFIRPGEHSMGPQDWPAFLAFADKWLPPTSQ